MCGRTACALAPDEVCHACRYKDKQGKLQTPQWRNAPNGKQFYPSHNISPGLHTPVLLSSKHFTDNPDDSALVTERVIQPMLWGMVPSWHKDDPKKVAFETNNCRSEGMLQKRTFKVPLEKGRRCVVLAEGFFEWKRKDGSKQPYYIYFPQDDSMTSSNNDHIKLECKPEIKSESLTNDGVQSKSAHPLDDCKSGNSLYIKTESENNVEMRPDIKTESNNNGDGIDKDVQPGDSDPMVKVKDEPGLDPNDGGCSNKVETTKKENLTEFLEQPQNGRTGMQRLLTMAAVFDVWKPPDCSGDLYSYSVITIESSSAMSWIHHRMPAMLTSDEEISDWLDFGTVPLSKAVKLIRAVECLVSHPVSSVVNNSRNKTPDCVKRIDLTKKPKPSASSSFMMSWLSKGPKSSEEEDEPPTKKQKTS